MMRGSGSAWRGFLPRADRPGRGSTGSRRRSGRRCASSTCATCTCRSDGKYTRIVTAEAAALIRRPLTALLENLDPDMFWQINRGIAVNVHPIDVVERGDGEMVVKLRAGRAELPVSKTHQSRFRGM